MPCDRVANALVKNRNRLRSRAASTPLREQRVDLGVLEREVAGDADAVRDVDAEVVGREVERPGVEDDPGGVVDRGARAGGRFDAVGLRSRSPVRLRLFPRDSATRGGFPLSP